MLRWSVIFLIIAIIAGIFGFAGVAQQISTPAKIIFFVFTVLSATKLVFGMSLVNKSREK
ncbi:MAG: DUF1328 family protein [Bacteroidota bacterium]